MEDGIFFNQSKYIKEMLKKFGLEDSKPMKTPMSSDTKLTKDEECESVDSTKYRGMIGTTNLGLWYPKGIDIETIVYADPDHAGDYVDQKSTSGICTFVGCCLTSWFSKKQTALAISTTEAEYERELKLYDKFDMFTSVPGETIHSYYLRSEQYNLVFFNAKRMEFITKQPRLILPHGMLLTRLFKYVMPESPELSNDHYIMCDRVMYPLAAQQERKTRKDYGTRRGRSSTSSSSAFGQPSCSHPNDDDNDGNDEWTSCASTPSLTRFVNSLSNDIP
ncbi:hypothetical protein Tco_1029885 [Tanacetum coccineum]|uniref:Copia protein n=1 Tax=Tanacetum coccineum TaxID=301880 RepID=A0ABQ5G4T9_9ASTR